MKKTRRNKYGVSKKADRTWRDKVYGSRAEMQYAQHLDFVMKHGGSIESVVEQPRFFLTKARIEYRGDFLITESTGYQRVVDVKGMQTDVFKIKKRLWEHYGPPMPLELVKKSGDGWKTVETIDGPEEGEGQ